MRVDRLVFDKKIAHPNRWTNKGKVVRRVHMCAHSQGVIVCRQG